MKLKIKETYLLLIIVIGLVSLSVYTTYALFTASTTIDDVVSFNATLNTDNNLIEYEMITLSPGEVKMVEINVNNTYSTSLYYGAWYQIVSPSDTSDIVVGLTDDNTSSGSGALAKTSSIKLIVGLANNSSKTAVINIGTVGSTTSNLNLPTGRNLIPEGFDPTVADLVINSLKINGTEATTFPINTGSYNIDTTCSDASITYNQKTHKYEISNISKDKKATCGFNYTTKSNITYLNNYIISLAGTTQGTGQVVNENGYRYEGKNPNNYIYFNNELWRIIGVFDSASHGITNTNLVKIIRNDSIGGFIWDKTYKANNWANSSLYHILNDYYYNAINGTDGTYCYIGYGIKGNCNYIRTGLQADYRNMVQSVTWYLGGPSDYSNPVSTFYNDERDSTKKYSSNSAYVNNSIGLMYTSDYGYSVLSSSCARTTNLKSYNTNACAGNVWLKFGSEEWTVTHNSESSMYAFYINMDGEIINQLCIDAKSIRPVLYLKSNVKYINGTGTRGDPYIIDL